MELPWTSTASPNAKEKSNPCHGRVAPTLGPSCSFQAASPAPVWRTSKGGWDLLQRGHAGCPSGPCSHAGHMSSMGFLCFRFPRASQRSPHNLEMPESFSLWAQGRSCLKPLPLHDPIHRVAQPGHLCGAHVAGVATRRV